MPDEMMIPSTPSADAISPAPLELSGEAFGDQAGALYDSAPPEPSAEQVAPTFQPIDKKERKGRSVWILATVLILGIAGAIVVVVMAPGAPPPPVEKTELAPTEKAPDLTAMKVVEPPLPTPVAETPKVETPPTTPTIDLEQRLNSVLAERGLVQDDLRRLKKTTGLHDRWQSEKEARADTKEVLKLLISSAQNGRIPKSLVRKKIADLTVALSKADAAGVDNKITGPLWRELVGMKETVQGEITRVETEKLIREIRDLKNRVAAL